MRLQMRKLLPKLINKGCQMIAMFLEGSDRYLLVNRFPQIVCDFKGGVENKKLIDARRELPGRDCPAR